MILANRAAALAHRRLSNRADAISSPNAGLTLGCRNSSTAAAPAKFDLLPASAYVPGRAEDTSMKIVNSLKTLKKRDKGCRIVRRKGRVYVINKANPRYKARQG